MRFATGVPQQISPSPQVREAILNEIGLSGFTAFDRRLSSVAAELAVEPMGVRGLNEGIFYAPEALPQSAASLAPGLAVRSHPTTGTMRCLVLLVDFDDNPGSRAPDAFQSMLFSRSQYATGSLRDFYMENSYGQLDVDGEVVGWLRMPQTYAYYVNGQSGMGDPPQNAQTLTADALALAAQQVDFSRFDGDGDGYVDGLFLVHAGMGAEADTNRTTRPQKIWSHQWNLTQPFTANGVTVYSYCIQPEDGKIGVFCHEFGHMLGLPDLYDTTYQSGGVGVWCVMGSGSWNNGGLTPGHFCVWSKARLNWLQPDIIASAATVTLKPVENTAQAARVWTGGQLSQEYFLLENRQRQGFDAYLPADGLLIWHIDETQHNNDHRGNYWVGLEQADGRLSLELNQNQGDPGDVYPGSANNARFDAASNPNSNDQFGRPTSISITNITVVSPDMTCDITV